MVKTVQEISEFYWELRHDGRYIIEIPIENMILHNTVKNAIDIFNQHSTEPIKKVKFVLSLNERDSINDKVQDAITPVIYYILFGVKTPRGVEVSHQVPILEWLDDLQKKSSIYSDKHIQSGYAFSNLKRLGKEKGLI